jgi:hypothetical protein
MEFNVTESGNWYNGWGMLWFFSQFVKTRFINE